MNPKITIGIPSYSRPNDLSYLFSTIKALVEYPDEIVIADDNSPDQEEILRVVSQYRSFFQSKGINFIFIKNKENLGYDKNLKVIINSASSEYVMFIGNDDAVDPKCISEVKSFLTMNHCRAYSRSFWRFHHSIGEPFGRSWFFKSDHIFNQSNSSPNFYYRLGAYFGGLIFDRVWAKSKETDVFDGTLYYQIYLMACAYYEGGIGYISYPIVGARIEGLPLFGVAKSESSVHRPGNYSASARSSMWSSIVAISDFIDKLYLVNSKKIILYELKTRMSFHLFEMYRNRSRRELLLMINELRKLHLYWHPVPVVLSLLVFFLGRHSESVFYTIRKIYQR